MKLKQIWQWLFKKTATVDDVVQAIRKIHIEQGDIIVVQCEHLLTQYQRQHIADELKIPFNGHSVLILDGGLKFTVVHSEAACAV